MRETFLWKLGRKGVSTKFIEEVKGVYKNKKMTVKCGGRRDRALEEFVSDTELRHGCQLSPILLTY
jgi:hypothetical protein